MRSSFKKTLLILAAFIILLYLYKSGFLGRAKVRTLKTLASLRNEAKGFFNLVKKAGS